MAFAAYSDAIFKQKAGADALQNAYGANATTPSDQVKLKAPDIAENGAVVPVSVETDMDAESIAILITENPFATCHHCGHPSWHKSDGENTVSDG
jgi:sulfur-oxidizing protein SoxY